MKINKSGEDECVLERYDDDKGVIDFRCVTHDSYLITINEESVYIHNSSCLRNHMIMNRGDSLGEAIKK